LLSGRFVAEGWEHGVGKLIEFWRRIRFLFRRNRLERELEDEMRFHLEMKIQDNLKAGMSPEEAYRAARLQFGNSALAKEDSRKFWGFGWLDNLWQDLRYGARTLAKSPGFTAVAVLSLALGVGANTAIFAVVDALLLKPLPVADPDELVVLGSQDKDPVPYLNFDYPGFEAFRDAGSDLFQEIFAYSHIYEKIGTVYRGEAEATRAQVVSGAMYSVLGVRPAVGRLLGPEDDRTPGCCPVAVLSYDYWQRRFGGDPQIIGHPITLNGTPYTVIGVAPERFRGLHVGESPDITVPLSMSGQLTGDDDYPQKGGGWWLKVIARKKKGVSNERVRATLEPVLRRLTEDVESADVGSLKLTVEPANRGVPSAPRRTLRDPLLVLLGTVGALLLIACLNIANLLLARATARQKEMAVRAAIGAGRGRLLRQLLTESSLLTLFGGLFGVLIATQLAPALVTWFADEATREALDLRPNGRVFAFTAAVAGLTGALFAVAPALRATRVELADAMKTGNLRAPGDRGRSIAARALVVSEVALALPLLVLAGLFVQSLENLHSTDLGYRPENVLLFSVDPWQAGYFGSRRVGFHQELLDRVESMPGVKSATLSMFTMVMIGWFDRVEVAGSQPRSEPDRSVGRNLGGPRFFETMGMTILRGRDFSDLDTASSTPVAAVNESFVRHYLGGKNPIGQEIRLSRFDHDRRRQIIAVVQDARDRGVREASPPMVYTPYLQQAERGPMTFVLRTVGPPVSVAAQVREQVRALDRSLPVMQLMTLEARIGESLVRERLMAHCSSAIGFLALLLTSIGLYGVLSYMVSRRTAEIGIRMALGAQASGIRRLIMNEGLTLAMVGVAVGVLAAFGLTRLAESQLYGITPTDPMTLSVVCLALIGVALLASYIPARRATNVDPMVALRHE
jgi:predicted permease